MTFVAIRDLISEKLITTCLVLSVAAVLAPIMLLASVKVGFIDRIRNDFINDPSFREIRPSEAEVRDVAFFDDVRTWPGVAFAMPSVSLTPREVDLIYTVDSSPQRSEARLIPSDASDPLFERLDGLPPLGERVVLSADVAAETGLTIGDTFDVAVDRIEGNARRRVNIPVTVSGILPSEAVARPTIFADPSIDRDVEYYRAGIAVPKRGWRSIDTETHQSFAALAVMSAAPLAEVLRSDLRLRLAASSVERVEAKVVAARIGLEENRADGRWSAAYLVERGSGYFSADDLEEAIETFSNSDVRVFGVNAPLIVQVAGFNLTLASTDSSLDSSTSMIEAEWKPGPDASYGFNDGVALPSAAYKAWQDSGAPAQMNIRIELPEGAKTPHLDVAVRIIGEAPSEAALASPALIGMLMRGFELPIVFDAAARTIVEQSSGYRGFRVVAKSFEDVPSLVDRFAANMTPVSAKADEIVKLQRLEWSLNILVVTIGAVALVGGAAILASSFFANVQRKRVDYATIRLIGMRKRQVFGIPMVQALCIAVMGYLLSCLLFAAVSRLLNGVIASELGFDGQLSVLYPSHFLATAAAVIFGTCAASLWASREVTRIDPAQALRS